MRRPAAFHEQPLQRDDLCLQRLRAAPHLCLLKLTLALRGTPLIGTHFLRFVPTPPGFELLLALLLPLHLGPDADRSPRTTTHL